MVKLIMTMLTLISLNAESFTDKIPSEIINNILTKLNKDCKIYNTEIYSSCYSDLYGRVLYTVYNVDKRAYEVNISTRPSFYSGVVNKHQAKWYKDSGYDKGHLAWDAVFDYDYHKLKLTYDLELNIVPMKPKVNRHQWSYIEQQVLKIIWNHEATKITIVDILKPSNEYLKNTIINIPKEMYKVVMYNNIMLCFKVDQFEIKKNIEPYTIDCSELKDMGLN